MVWAMENGHEIIMSDVEGIIKSNEGLMRSFDGQSVLVTGGAGFLGSYFVDLLAAWNEKHAAKPCEIYCMDTFITGTPKRLAHLEGRPHFHKLRQSVTEPLPDALKADYILHFASIASPTFYRKYPLETIDSNVAGTRNLLEHAAANKIKSMLFLSTSEIYGDPSPENIPTREDYRGNVSCTGPRACYDESKRLGETLCTTYFRLKGVPVKMARPFNVYGPGLRLDDRRVIPDMFSGAFGQRQIVLHSDGSPTRSFCYVSDAVDCFLRILLSQHSGEPFNVGNDQQEISMLDLARMVSSLFWEGVSVSFQKSAEGDYLADNPQRRCPDLKKVKRLAGHEPRVSLQDGLKRLKSWYESELQSS